MLIPIKETHWSDANGNPAGGCSYGVGFAISWQNGPLGRQTATTDRKEPNGAFVESVIAAAVGRLEFYQSSKFECAENAEALRHLKAALKILNDRTADRERRAVEGTHEK